MARVKRGVTAKARHKKVLGKAKGYYGARSKLLQDGQAGSHQGGSVRLPRSSSAQASVPRIVDYPHQCSSTHARHVIQPFD